MHALLLLLVLGWTDPIAAVNNELHVVALGQGRIKEQGSPGTADIVVNRPGKKVTLVLVGAGAIEWTVKAGDGTELARIIVGGNSRQSIQSPEGVAVTNISGDRGPGEPALSCIYAIRDRDFRHFADAVRSLTKTDISSYLGMSNPPDAGPIAIHEVQRDERLEAGYPKPIALKDVPDLSFKAIHYTRHEHKNLFAAAEFTLLGPKMRSIQSLPDRVQKIVADPETGKVFGLRHDGVVECDLKTGVVGERLHPHPDSAFAIDSRRALLLTADRDHFYEYDLRKKTSRTLADLARGYEVVALACPAKQPRIYALSEAHDGPIALDVFNQAGAMIKHLPLQGPLPPGVIGHGSDTQLIAIDDRLVVVSSPESHAANSVETFIYLLDPKTATLTLTARYKSDKRPVL